MAMDRPPDHVPPEVLARADFAEACTNRDLGGIFGIAKKWGGVGFTVSHMARRCEMTVSQVLDYMKGARQAQHVAIFERVADGLHIPGRMLMINPRPWEIEQTAETFEERVRAQLTDTEHSQIPQNAPTRLWTGETTSVSLQENLMPDEESDIMGMIQEADRTDIGPGTIEGLYTVFDKLCRDYPSASAPELRRKLKRLYSRVMNMRQGRMTLAQHKELMAISGWITALLACVDWDMNQRDAAETARDATLRFAKDTGHSELLAWSYEMQTWFALTEGRYSDATSIAKAAQTIGGENSAIVQLIMQEARGWARLGNRKAAESAIERGRELLEKLPTVEYPRHFVFDQSKFPFYVASCYQWLGEDSLAEKYALQVLSECEKYGTTVRSPMRLADTLITLGIIYARRGDLDGALESGSRALAYDRKSGPSLIIRASELNRIMSDKFPQSRQAREFNEKFRATCEAFGMEPPEQMT
jgi:tetratricopeptide (TPR) repeat protein